MDNNKGFTLIEVIISLAIVGIVTLAIFSFFNFNVNAFNKNSEEMKEQSSLRLVSLKLTNELRNIGYIDLGNYSFENTSSISAISTTDSFIYNYDNTIKKGNPSSIIDYAEDEVRNVNFSLTEENERFFLSIEVLSDTNSYSTEILLNNIITDATEVDGTLIQIDPSDVNAGNFTSIQFNFNKPPIDYISSNSSNGGGNENEETDPLALVYPPEYTKKNKTFEYTATAKGGTPPYTYIIDNVSYDGGTANDIDGNIAGDTIIWQAPNENNKVLTFSVSVTDDLGETSSVTFEVETSSSGN